MSSRNAYLTSDERRKATVLYRALKAGEARIYAGENDGNNVREAMKDILSGVPEFNPDYFDIVHPESFEKVNEICRDVLLIIAGTIGSVRLIDNMPVQRKT
jgi:pantothenate synthetase